MSAEISFNDFIYSRPETLLELCCVIKAEENFLVPKSKFRALHIRLDCSLGVAAVTIALGEIELVSGDQERVRLRDKRRLECSGIILVFSNVPAAGAILDLPNMKAAGNTSRAIRRAFAKFMQNAPIADLDSIASELRSQILNVAASQLHIVNVMAQTILEARRIEAGLEDNDLVGIDHQAVIDGGILPQLLQRKASIGGKILPGFVDDVPGDVFFVQVFTNETLSSVFGACIHQQNVIEQRQNAVQAPSQDVRLVSCDHAQADPVHSDFSLLGTRVAARADAEVCRQLPLGHSRTRSQML